MKTFTFLQNVNENKKYFSLAIGNFDGVHEGHKKLLKETVIDAQANDGLSGAFTFWPHPLKILKQNIPFKLLSTLERKQQLLDQTGIDAAFFISFTKEIMELSPEEFVKKVLLEALHVSSVHVGFNFSFGKNAQGNTNDLLKYGKKYGFKVNILSEVNIDGQIVSSTLIRQCIEDGEIALANKFLGYNYLIQGKVVTGDQRGRQIGFPTANLLVNEEIIIPAKGVYVANVKIDDTNYKAVLNIGNKPTFGSDLDISIEAHILGFNGDLYGKNLDVEIIERLRGEKRFANVEELIQQIGSDIEKALQIF